MRGSTTGRPVMAALDLLGRRGALRLLWELQQREGQTFRALASACGLPPGTLNVRLRELRLAGVLVASHGYRLTPSGHALVVALRPLLRWSDRWAATLTLGQR